MELKVYVTPQVVDYGHVKDIVKQVAGPVISVTQSLGLISV